MNQEIRFCRSFDGARIGYALSGYGPPLVMAPLWFGHLELNWQDPVWRPWLQAISTYYGLVRMDQRGCGLSDRDMSDFSFEAFVKDLEAVVEAAEHQRFALYGGTQGGAIAIEYAARHPERVTHLVLFNAYARGWLKRGLPQSFNEENEARLKLIELGWDRDEPYYRQMMASAHIAQGASMDELKALGEIARHAMSARSLIEIIRTMFNVDVRTSAAGIKCPTLVMHARAAPRVPFEEGRLLASLIPGARLVTLETANNILLEREPAFSRFLAELREFLPRSQAAQNRDCFRNLTNREADILVRIAQGLDNSQIAAHLGLSEKTVRNYVTQIFDKLGVENRSQAIVLALDGGLGSKKAL